MKIKKLIIITILSLVEIFLLSIPFYNRVLKPFEGYNKEILLNNINEELDDKKSYFFKNYIDYDFYEENYKTSFYYKHSKEAFLFFFNYYVDNAYSYIIYLNDDYANIKNKILEKYNFAEIPFEYGNDIDFVNTIKIDDYILKEIAYDYDDKIDYYYSAYPRRISYWLSYNDTKREISFSILQHELSFDYYNSEETIKKFLKDNLYI